FSHPRAWKPFAGGSMLIPDGAGSVSGRIRLAHAGYYTVWLGGSVRSTADLLVDGKVVNSVRDQLNNRGQYVELAATHLAAGAHDIEIRFGGPSLAPGSAGTAAPVGPLAFSS